LTYSNSGAIILTKEAPILFFLIQRKVCTSFFATVKVAVRIFDEEKDHAEDKSSKAEYESSKLTVYEP